LWRILRGEKEVMAAVRVYETQKEKRGGKKVVLDIHTEKALTISSHTHSTA
jgi:hypothetical protein